MTAHESELIAALKQGAWTSQAMADAVGRPQKHVSVNLLKLFQRGYVTRQRSRGPRSFYYYGLPVSLEEFTRQATRCEF